MKVKLNGESREVGEGMTITQLLDSFGLAAASVAIERNRVVVEPVCYSSTTIECDDELEIVRFVGGG